MEVVLGRIPLVPCDMAQFMRDHVILSPSSLVYSAEILTRPSRWVSATVTIWQYIGSCDKYVDSLRLYEGEVANEQVIVSQIVGAKVPLLVLWTRNLRVIIIVVQN